MWVYGYFHHSGVANLAKIGESKLCHHSGVVNLAKIGDPSDVLASLTLTFWNEILKNGFKFGNITQTREMRLDELILNGVYIKSILTIIFYVAPQNFVSSSATEYEVK